MCFNVEYSAAALASEDVDLLLEECKVHGCCRHLESLEGKLELDADLRETILQASSLGKLVAEQGAEVKFPRTSQPNRTAIESSPMRSCGSWVQCGVSVQRWLRRMALFLSVDNFVGMPSLDSCQEGNEAKCAAHAAEADREDQFSEWYACMDDARAPRWDLPGSNADVSLPMVPTRGYFVGHDESRHPSAFIAASLGTGEVLWVEYGGTAWKWDIPCGELAEAFWVAQAVPSLLRYRPAVAVTLPFPMQPQAESRHVVVAPHIRSILDVTHYQWLAASDLGRSRWRPDRTVCDRGNSYRRIVVEEFLSPRRGLLRAAGTLGPQYSEAAFKCTQSPIDSGGCAEFERLMKPLWGKQRCPAPP
ncbi:MAG: hypothetical protein H6718_18660 [Polyangiaceae bacterium]|nr:hypothetical protein [Myxococcales bacterium]MCB9587429.1 hypothetical protein [Polyangiaceae bacterium]MCB9605774.1 hypothetical protein [Polyangiaceae bacterium]